tara:strand:- start:530 stop:742 length:213 start_codon:yes stop_codon:yes gene_type:complete
MATVEERFALEESGACDNLNLGIVAALVAKLDVFVLVIVVALVDMLVLIIVMVLENVFVLGYVLVQLLLV